MKTELFETVNQLADQKRYAERCYQKKQRNAKKKEEAKKEENRAMMILSIIIIALMILEGFLETL